MTLPGVADRQPAFRLDGHRLRPTPTIDPVPELRMFVIAESGRRFDGASLSNHVARAMSRAPRRLPDSAHTLDDHDHVVDPAITHQI